MAVTLLPKDQSGAVGYINTNRDDPAFGQPVYQDQYGVLFYTQPGAAGRSETQVFMGRQSALPGYVSATKPSFEAAPLTGQTGAQIINSEGSAPKTISSTTGQPSQSSISNPVSVNATAGSLPTPNFGTPTGTEASNQWNTGINAGVEAAKANLLAEADKRAKEYQTKIDALEQKDKELQQLQDAGMLGLKDTTFAEMAEKRQALELEKQRFDENYNANQALIGELDELLTQGNEIVERMKGTTGLASIMNPRIAQTMSDVQARAGVIQAVMSARWGQMSQAQNQLQTTVSALESIYGDQIDYYKTVVNYYGSLKDENNTKILNLTKEQKAYADVKINLLENELAQIQDTAKRVEQAMLDPDTALMYAKSGVTLKDSVETINRKIATYQYQQEVADISNKMVLNGYSSTPIAGGSSVEIYDSNGTKHTYYKAPTAGEDGSFTLGTNQVRFDAQGNVIASGPTPADEVAAEKDKVLSPTEIANLNKLGIPAVYGMTQSQAAALAPKPQPGGYPTVELQRGSTGAEVDKLQKWLVANGYMTQTDYQTGPGIYGPKTEAAVKALQAQLNVDTSGGGAGRYGPKTIAAMQGKPAPAATTSTKTASSSTTTSSFGSLSNADKTKGMNWLINNGATQEEIDLFKTDREFQAFVMSQI